MCLAWCYLYSVLPSVCLADHHLIPVVQVVVDFAMNDLDLTPSLCVDHSNALLILGLIAFMYGAILCCELCVFFDSDLPIIILRQRLKMMLHLCECPYIVVIVDRRAI